MAELPLSASYHTLVLRSINFFEGNSPVQYYTATIDTAGRFIDMAETGCYCTPMKVQTLDIDSTGQIRLRNYSQVWQYEPTDSGYDHNSVRDRTLLDSVLYVIKADGHIDRHMIN